MQTFDFASARKQVTKLEKNFREVHELLDTFNLSITDRGAIDTILHKVQSETTKELLTGQLNENKGWVKENGVKLPDTEGSFVVNGPVKPPLP